MWRERLDGAGRRLFPARCVACGAAGEPLCPACAATLRAAPPGAPPLGVDRLASAFAYVDAGRELVARVKYRDARHALTYLAAVVAAAAAGVLGPASGSRPLAVTWPPTTAAHRRRRGFDPAEALARRVAATLEIAPVPMLDRLDATPQTGAGRAQRRAGPRYRARRPAPGSDATILVIDDVVTTGGTLTAAARALRAAGWQHVVAATAARTPAPSEH